MPKGWTENSQPLFAVIWEESSIIEGSAEEDYETLIDSWLFRSQAEAAMFVAEEIWERAELNKDNYPPKHLRAIQKALQAGKIFPLAEPDETSAVELWTWGTEYYFSDIPGDVITTANPFLMIRN
jgi:hypothetical protein